MSETKQLYPVTLAHETFVPTDDVVRALDGLFEQNRDARRQEYGLLTTSRRLLHRDAFRAGRYDLQMQEAVNRLDAEMGRKALALSGRMAERELPNGNVRFFFEVARQAELDRAVHAMIPLGGLKERLIDGNGALYMDVAKNALAQSVTQRRNVMTEFNARAHHVLSRERMTVSSPQIVTLDIDAYPLVIPPPSPVKQVVYDD